MLTSLGRLVSIIGGLLLIFLILYWGFSGLFPPEKRLTPQRREAMVQATQPLLTRMPKPANHITRLMVAPLIGDYTGEVGEHLRDTLDAEGFFNVLPLRAIDRARKQIHLEPEAPEDAAQGLRIARQAQCEQMLWGTVSRLSQQDDELAVEINLALYDVASGRPLWQEATHWKSTDPQTAGRRAGPLADLTASLSGMFLSLTLCLLFIVLFTLLLTPGIHKVLRLESNGYNLFLLGSLSLADGLVALLILRHSFGGMAWVVLALLLMIGSVWYNLWYCEFLERRR